MTLWTQAIPLPVTELALSRPRDETASADVVAAKAGDERAFERLYRRHVGRVYALAVRLSPVRDEADRLTQDVFVRAWERLGSFRGESAFGTWLHRLAVNVILGDRRRAGRLARWIAGGEEEAGGVGDPRAATPGLGLDLEAAIAGLPPGARAVFVLHDVEGYDHAEIAQLIGIAVGTSKAQLFRARRLLRLALDR